VAISLIVPAYQEERLIASSLGEIRARALEAGEPFEIVVIDDGSSDDTWNAIQRARADVPELVALRLSRNFGKESAIAAGLDVATGDACIVLDADLQHPPALIPRMVRLWRHERWDVVEAIKTHRGEESWSHRAVARTFYRVAGWLTGHELQDASDFKLLDRRVVDEWRRLGERATFFRGLVSWLGFRRTQIPFEVPPREGGGSRWSLRCLTSLAVHAVTSFSALPLQIVTVLGLITLIVAAGIGVQALRLWYTGEALPGFTTVIVLQLMIGGFLMMSLGIIGTYIARIYDEVKGRPRYVVRDVVGRDAARS
jgi:dolichol-phosphate mannosyltransferase